MNALTGQGMLQLNHDTLQKVPFQSLQQYVNSVTLADYSDKIYDILKELRTKGIQYNTSYNLPDVFERLTHKQLEELPKHIPEVLTDKKYFGSLYKKGLGLELEELSAT